MIDKQIPDKRVHLAPLLFGESIALKHSDSRSFGDQINRVFPGLQAYDPIGAAHQFHAKNVTLRLPGITITSSALSPTYVERLGKQVATLMIPMTGQFSVMHDKTGFKWGADIGGAYLPEFDGRTSGWGDTRSMVMFSLRPAELEHVARAMLGLAPDRTPQLGLEIARPTPLNITGRPVHAFMHQIGMLIDLYQCDAEMLHRLGLQDMLYRSIVMMLQPGLFMADAMTELPAAYNKRQLDRVCAFIVANLEKPLTLTMLEQMAGMSRRALQYAFMKRYACSPTDWIRQQRLQRARQMLLRADPDSASVTTIALACGFTHLGRFARSYLIQFGESPQQTLFRI